MESGRPRACAILAEMALRRRFRVFALFLPALMTAGSSGGLAADQDPAGDYAALVRRARGELSKNDPASGLALLDQAVRLDPEGEEALALLGRTYLRLERYPQADAALRRAAALADRPGGTADERAEVRIDLAVALARRERSDEAIEVLRQVLALAPGRPTIHHDIGRIYLAIGGFEKAEAEFREEVRIQETIGGAPAPALAMSLEGLGVAAYRLGDDATALAAFERRARLPNAADSVEGRYHHALVLARLGRHEEAAAAFRDILKREPDNRGALQNLARSDVPLGLDDERRRSLARFEELYGEEEGRKALRVRVRDLRAEASRRADANDLKGAVNELSEAARLSPGDSEIQIELGRYLRRAGDRKGSEMAFRRVLEAEPLNAEAHYQIGRLLAGDGDVQGALASLERATRIEPLALNYHAALAQTYLRLRRNDEGVQELRLARSLDPGDSEAAFNLGVGLAQAGSLREAAGELEAALKMGYDRPPIHQVLEQIYTALGDEERAAREKAASRRQDSSERPSP